MRLGAILKRLALIELSSLSMADAGEIRDADRGRVISAINEGLARLYGRFAFREKTLLIEQIANITEYKLHAKYAWSRRDENDELHHYIMDSEDEPYTGDLIKILSVWDDDGRQLKLNDTGTSYSLYTPHPDTLLVPRPDEGQVFSLTYQALPDEIPHDAPDTYEFELPEVMKGAIASYASYLIFLSIGTQEAIGKSQLLLVSYEEQCVDAQLSDTLSIGVTNTSKKFHDRGFV